MSQSLSILGFVPVEEIQNVFTHELSKIEEDIGLNGYPLDHKIVMEWIDSIRLRLVQRAKFNIDEFVRKNPIVKKEQREAKDADLAKGRELKDHWQDKVKANRDAAIRECYK